MAEGRETIIFLDKNRIFVYDGNGILRLDVPDTVIRDVDVIDKSGFDTLVDTFIKARKLDPAKMWIILPDAVCLTKDFTETDPAKAEIDIKDFLDAIPYDQVISKRYRSGTGVRVITANLEYAEAVIEIFERDGFVSEGIVPAAIFPGFNTRKILDADFARYISENKNLMRTANMITKVALPASNNAQESVEPKKKSRLLPYLLIGFGVLLIVLVAVLVIRSR